MKWIVVKTYGNGAWMNMVYPMWFEHLSQAEKMCKELNESNQDDCSNDRWVAMPIMQYAGPVW